MTKSLKYSISTQISLSLLLTFFVVSFGGCSKKPSSKPKQAVTNTKQKPPGISTWPAGPTIDLLSTINLKRDQVRGEFQLENGALIIPSSREAQLEFDAEFPEIYSLMIEATRLSGQESLNIGLEVGGSPTLLVFDGWGKKLTGLSKVDGKLGNNNETTNPLAVFDDNKPKLIKIDVRPDRIQVFVDGGGRLDWYGDAKRLTLDQRFFVRRNATKPMICSWQGKFRISRMELTPGTESIEEFNVFRKQQQDLRLAREAKQNAIEMEEKRQRVANRLAADADKANKLASNTAGTDNPKSDEAIDNPSTDPELANVEEPRIPDVVPPPLKWQPIVDPITLGTPIAKSERLANYKDGFPIFPYGPSNFFAVTGTEDGQHGFRAYDIRSGKQIGKTIASRGFNFVWAPKMSPTGRYFARYRTKNGKNRISVCSFITGQEACSVELARQSEVNPEQNFWFGNNHRLISTHDRIKTTELRITDIRSPESPRTLVFEDEVSSLCCAASSAGGNYFAMAWRDSLQIVDLNKGEVVGKIPWKGSVGVSAHMAFRADGVELAVLASDLTRDSLRLILVDCENGTCQFAEKHCEDVSAHYANFGAGAQLAWFPDNRTLLLNGYDVIDRQTGQAIFHLPNVGADSTRKILTDTTVTKLVTKDFEDKYFGQEGYDRKAIEHAMEVVAKGGKPIDAVLPPLTIASNAGSRVVSTSDPISGWTMVPDLRPTMAPGIKLPYRLARHAESNAMIHRVCFASPDTGIAVAQIHLTRTSRERERRLLVRYQLSKSGAHGSVEIRKDYRLLDISADGNLALIGLVNDVGGYPRLDIVSISDKKHVAGWRPFDGEAWKRDRLPSKQPGPANPQTVLWAKMLEGDRVLTANLEGKIVCWQLPECRAIYECEDFGTVYGSSANGQYIVGFDGDAVRILNTATGQWAGELRASSPIQQFFRAGIRQDGRELVASLQTELKNRLVRWDLTTGELVDEFEVHYGGGANLDPFKSLVHRQRGIVYHGDRYVLINDFALIDLQNRRAVWRYMLNRGGHAVGGLDDREWFYQKNVNDSIGEFYDWNLTATSVPSSQVLPLIENVTLENLLVLKKGQRLAVDVDFSAVGLGDDDTLVNEAMQKSGIIVDPSASYQYSISIGIEKTGNKKKIPYFVLGPDPPGVLRPPRIRKFKEIEEKRVVLTVEIRDPKGELHWSARIRHSYPTLRTKTDDPGAELLDAILDNVRRLVSNSDSLKKFIPVEMLRKSAWGNTGSSTLEIDGEVVTPLAD